MFLLTPTAGVPFDAMIAPCNYRLGERSLTLFGMTTSVMQVSDYRPRAFSIMLITCSVVRTRDMRGKINSIRVSWAR
jgi:hypothetical protein